MTRRMLYLALAGLFVLVPASSCLAFVMRDPSALTEPSVRARYLNPNTGRFWTADSFEGNQSDPLSLHKYLYCHANPVNMVDPSGHESLASLNFSMAIIGQLASGYSKASGAALEGVRGIFGGSDELNKLILGVSYLNAGIDAYNTATMVTAASFGVYKIARVLTSVNRSIGRALTRAINLGVDSLENEAVFYSGQAGKTRALSSGRKLVNKTPGGAYLDSVDMSRLDQEQYQAVWSRLSEEYARAASGEIHAYVSRESLSSVWESIEKPALLLNAKVKKIVVTHLSQSGTVLKTEIIYK